MIVMMMMSRPVCHNGWDYADANVVCRSLGYIGALDFTLRCSMSGENCQIIMSIIFTRSHFGPAATWLEFSDVDCRGDEVRLYKIYDFNIHFSNLPSGESERVLQE